MWREGDSSKTWSGVLEDRCCLLQFYVSRCYALLRGNFWLRMRLGLRSAGFLSGSFRYEKKRCMCILGLQLVGRRFTSWVSDDTGAK